MRNVRVDDSPVVERHEANQDASVVNNWNRVLVLDAILAKARTEHLGSRKRSAWIKDVGTPTPLITVPRKYGSADFSSRRSLGLLRWVVEEIVSDDPLPSGTPGHLALDGDWAGHLLDALPQPLARRNQDE